MPDKPRRPSFRLDNDIFIACWATNQKHCMKQKCNEWDPEQLYENYRTLCLEIFSCLTKPFPPNLKPINGEDVLLVRLPMLFDDLMSKEDKERSIYLFMEDRVLAKAEKMLAKLSEYNENVTLPIGHEHRRYYRQSTQSWKKRASQFG